MCMRIVQRMQLSVQPSLCLPAFSPMLPTGLIGKLFQKRCRQADTPGKAPDAESSGEDRTQTHNLEFEQLPELQPHGAFNLPPMDLRRTAIDALADAPAGSSMQHRNTDATALVDSMHVDASPHAPIVPRTQTSVSSTSNTSVDVVGGQSLTETELNAASNVSEVSSVTDAIADALTRGWSQSPHAAGDACGNGGMAHDDSGAAMPSAAEPAVAAGQRAAAADVADAAAGSSTSAATATGARDTDAAGGDDGIHAINSAGGDEPSHATAAATATPPSRYSLVLPALSLDGVLVRAQVRACAGHAYGDGTCTTCGDGACTTWGDGACMHVGAVMLRVCVHAWAHMANTHAPTARMITD